MDNIDAKILRCESTIRTIRARMRKPLTKVQMRFAVQDLNREETALAKFKRDKQREENRITLAKTQIQRPKPSKESFEHFMHHYHMLALSEIAKEQQNNKHVEYSNEDIWLKVREILRKENITTYPGREHKRLLTQKCNEALSQPRIPKFPDPNGHVQNMLEGMYDVLS